jgi:predicted 3-demethylubiquinone-9 3-methyltransferase (glyoxalase superfamily)
MQKITPFLWFDSQAEEAADFYVSVFGSSRIVHIDRYGKAGAEASGRPCQKSEVGQKTEARRSLQLR